VSKGKVVPNGTYIFTYVFFSSPPVLSTPLGLGKHVPTLSISAHPLQSHPPLSAPCEQVHGYQPARSTTSTRSGTAGYLDLAILDTMLSYPISTETNRCQTRETTSLNDLSFLLLDSMLTLPLGREDVRVTRRLEEAE